ncbi:hypothetical protein OEA41_000103 [Lepraria neglecta]|uniref:Terpene synthase n=1 Tax=Lepraria neglecta TaxID=209136 RepID=A0AAE0DP62_9LECA|nr:hypothetical protein OEA41_000103 [Lepraria neglecta]
MEYQYRSRGRNNKDMEKGPKMSSPLSYIISFLSRLILPGPVEEPATAATPTLSTPPSLFQHQCHRLVDPVTEEVDGYFLKNWNFETEKAKKKFVAAGFSRVTCLYFPMALDDRIHFACRLLTILFLIDDVLDHLSFEDGSIYNNKLMPIMRGDTMPDRSVPVEWMMFDLWESMRAHDKVMANEVLEPVFVFMRAQTDRTRAESMSLGTYFEYREKDVGKAFEKEVAAAKKGHKEGGALCSSVQIMAHESDLSIAASKRVLWILCREWESVHQQLVAKREGDLKKASPAVLDYMKGLEYQMSGNTQWSHTTKRYNEVADF